MTDRLISVLFVLNFLLEIIRCTHVFNMDRDFNKVKSQQPLAVHVEEVLKKLQTFKVPVHPRIRLLYRLLKRGMARYAHRVADSLYVPNVYRAASAEH